MKKIITILLFFIIANIFITAEIVVLNDESVIRGNVIYSDDLTIIIKRESGNEITIDKKEIKAIYFSEVEYKTKNSIKGDEIKPDSTDEKAVTETKKTSPDNKLDKIKNEYFFGGVATSVFSNSSILLGLLPPLNMAGVGFFYVPPVSFTLIGLSFIPYAGPAINANLCFISGIVLTFSFGPNPYTTPIGAILLLDSAFQIIAFIMEVGAGYFAKEKINTLKNQKVTMFFAPQFKSEKFDNISVLTGFTVRL